MASPVIKVPFALTRAGDLVHISDVQERGRHPELACPFCRTEGLIAKFPGTGPRPRTQHFSHPGAKLHSPCSQETVLHETAKLLLRDRLIGALRKGERFDLIHRCKACRSRIRAGVSRDAVSVELEYRLASNAVRADIGVLDGGGKIVRAIEVVCTHYLEPETQEAYRKLEIPVWLYFVRGINSLSAIRTKRCLHAAPLIEHCQGRDHVPKLKPNLSDGLVTERFLSTPRSLYVTSEPCGRCRTPFKHAFVWDGGVLRPEHFTHKELGAAILAGASIKPLWIAAFARNLDFNVCPNCGKNWDDFRLHDLASKLMQNAQFLEYRVPSG
jgi:hypothetical protein